MLLFHKDFHEHPQVDYHPFEERESPPVKFTGRPFQFRGKPQEIKPTEPR
jgi:hypothetical protein